VEEKEGMVLIGHGHKFDSLTKMFEEFALKRFSLNYLEKNGEKKNIMLQFNIPPIPKPRGTKAPEKPKVEKIAIVELEFRKTDYLYILERELLIKKNWKYRYFVLDKNILKYFEDDEKQKKISEVEIEEVNDVTMMANYNDRQNVIAVSLNYIL
jgi:hypothetical protein